MCKSSFHKTVLHFLLAFPCTFEFPYVCIYTNEEQNTNLYPEVEILVLKRELDFAEIPVLQKKLDFSLYSDQLILNPNSVNYNPEQVKYICEL